jgi:transposase InsO family protein
VLELLRGSISKVPVVATAWRLRRSRVGDGSDFRRSPESARDLERKLAQFQTYYNEARRHASLEGHTPLTFASEHTGGPADLNDLRWVSHCRGLVPLPVAA